MTTTHIFFIPGVLLVGFVLGWLQGRKALVAQQEELRAAEARKAARRQGQAAQAGGTADAP